MLFFFVLPIALWDNLILAEKMLGRDLLIGNFFPWKIFGHFDFTDETANLGD